MLYKRNVLLGFSKKKNISHEVISDRMSLLEIKAGAKTWYTQQVIWTDLTEPIVRMPTAVTTKDPNRKFR